jgi:hypothetical protein
MVNHGIENICIVGARGKAESKFHGAEELKENGEWKIVNRYWLLVWEIEIGYL